MDLWNAAVVMFVFDFDLSHGDLMSITSLEVHKTVSCRLFSWHRLFTLFVIYYISVRGIRMSFSPQK